MIFIDHRENDDAVLVMGVLTSLAVAVSIGSAFPWVRNTHHKWALLTEAYNTQISDITVLTSVFERHHRFVGWWVTFFIYPGSFAGL